MNFLEYSNKHQVNIIPKEPYQELTREVFGVVASNISKSLGPLGASATILDGMMTEATKDGYAIFSKYCFHNRYKKMIYNLIKTPCERLNNTVGDGTTTAIVFANYLFQNYQARRAILETLYRLPRSFVQSWDKVIADLIGEIGNVSKPIDAGDYDTIHNIAYVTSNGNKEISDAIAATYKETPTAVIKQKDSPTNKSYITPIVGFEFPASLIDEAYVRNEDLSVEEKDIHVMLFDHKIGTDFCENVIFPINNVLRAEGQKLLIMAPAYDEYLTSTILRQYVNREYQQYRKLNLIISQYPIGKLESHKLKDLSTILRSTVISEDIANSVAQEIGTKSEDKFVQDILEDSKNTCGNIIGTVKSALLSCTNGSIFRPEDIESDERYQDVLRAAKKELADILATTDNERKSFASKIYEANARVSQLEMHNYIYYVGADSDLQKKILWDSIDDVIKCVRSAIKYGIVPGCQLSIVNASNKLIDQALEGVPEDQYTKLSDDIKLRVSILEMIRDAVLNTYATVLHGPNGWGIIKTIDMWNLVKEDAIDELRERAKKKGEEIIAESVKSNKVFDLETLQYNENIITSAETDSMVLTAASELVKILISANQCVFLDSEINQSHSEEVDIHV